MFVSLSKVGASRTRAAGPGGWLALYEGDLVAARARQEESLALRRALGDRREVAVSLTILGRVAIAEGDVDAAHRLFVQTLPLHQEVGNHWGIALALEGLVRVCAASDPARALGLAGAADALRVAMRRPLPPVEWPDWQRVLDVARQALDSRATEAAWEEGRALSPDQAIARALTPMPTAHLPTLSAALA